MLNPLKREITPDQFGHIVQKLPEIHAQSDELRELANAQPQKVQEIFGSDFAWSDIYELSYAEQMAALFMALNIHTHIIEAAGSENPYDALINLIEEGGTLDQWYELNEDDINKKHLFWLVMILQRNVLSIMLHHQSLGSLVEEVRNGNDEAFFKAVSIDRSILTCPTLANRLAKAEFLGEKQFFLHLRRAIKGPSKKHMITIGDLRYGIVLLRESGFDSFTDDQLIRFFVANRLYPDHPNAIKNLRKHIHVAKKFATT